jgi:hypothetical protein
MVMTASRSEARMYPLRYFGTKVYLTFNIQTDAPYPLMRVKPRLSARGSLFGAGITQEI